jgi:hypothetical protein
MNYIGTYALNMNLSHSLKDDLTPVLIDISDANLYWQLKVQLDVKLCKKIHNQLYIELAEKLHNQLHAELSIQLNEQLLISSFGETEELLTHLYIKTINSIKI